MEPQTGHRGTVWRTAVLAVVACGLVLVVALGSSRSGARTGGLTLFVIVLDIFLIFVALMAYALWRRLGNKDDRQLPLVPWTKKLINILLIVMLLAGVVGLRLLGPGHETVAETTTTGIRKVKSPYSPGGGGSPIYRWLFVGLAAVAVAVVVALLTRRLWGDLVKKIPGRPGRARVLPTDESDYHAGVLAAVEDSLEEIQREADPRRAVIRAYVKMGQILAEHGLGRLTHEAPTEYLNRAFTGIQLSRSAAERLTDLFVRARFSPHRVDPQLKEDAIAALTAVRDELQAASQ